MLITFKLEKTLENGQHIFGIYKKWLTEKDWMKIGLYNEEEKMIMLTDDQALTIDALQQIIAFSKH